MLIQTIASSILNRCRGTQWFGLIPSTGIGRILACIGLGVINGIPHGWLCASLLSIAFLIWAIKAWDVYWAAAGGNNTVSASGGIPWINDTLTAFKIPVASRLWGIAGMGLRQGAYALPIFTIMYIFTNNLLYIPLGLIPLLFGLPYYLFSLINTSKYVTWSEYLIGAIWGILIGV